jgi:hypothetical protein
MTRLRTPQHRHAVLSQTNHPNLPHRNPTRKPCGAARTAFEIAVTADALTQAEQLNLVK